MSTEDLQTIKGIGAKTAEQLIQAGIPTPIALATCNVQKLIAIGIPKAKAMDDLPDGMPDRCWGIPWLQQAQVRMQICRPKGRAMPHRSFVLEKTIDRPLGSCVVAIGPDGFTDEVPKG